MRELSTLSSKEHAERLTGFLATKSIQTRLDDEDGQWVVWIVNDDDRQTAEEALQQFLQDPDDDRFVAAAGKARELARQQQKKKKRIKRREIDLTRRWSGSWWHAYPATYILIGFSVLVAVLCTDFRQRDVGGWGMPALCNDQDSWLLDKLRMVGVGELQREAQSLLQSELQGGQIRLSQEQLELLISSQLSSHNVFLNQLLRGQIWRAVTPIFLHFGVLHLLFNMMWLRGLGGSIEFVRGTRRFVALVLIIAVLSNLAQFYWSGPRFGGMSGVVFGLIGYAWMKGRTQPELGLGLDPRTTVYAFLWLFLCMTGSFGPIANAAHLGGLIVGVVIGGRQALWKRLGS